MDAGLISTLRELELCASMSDAEISALAALAKVERAEAGTVFVHEGDVPDAFYVLLEGEVEIVKSKTDDEGQERQFRIDIATPGTTLGEMALVHPGRRTASLQARVSSTLLRFDLSALRADARLLLKLTPYVAQDLSGRLRSTADLTAVVMQSELEQARRRVALGVFLVSIVWSLSLYALGLGALETFNRYFPNTTPLSLVLILLVSVVTFRAMRHTGYPLRSFGFTLQGWRRAAGESLLWSVALCIAVVLIKATFINTVPAYAGQALFDSTTNFRDAAGNFSWTIYWMTTLGYAAFCPLQEMVVRGGMQSAFQKFLSAGERSDSAGQAILLSNLIFAAFHAHVGLIFALVTFASGLFWGWMYNRQRTLLGVSISHVLVGVWVSSIVGL